MKELKINKVFPRDVDTLLIIKEVEDYLGMKNKEIDKLSSTELKDYIDEITETLIYKSFKGSGI